MPSSRSSYVVERDNSVEISEPVAPGANVRPRGGDVRAGDGVVRRRERGSAPPQLGALAAAGVAEVVVRRAPRAAVLATGTELRRPGEPLGPGEVYEANGLILAAQLASAGAAVERLAAVADDEEAHREAIARGLEHDVLVTSGGVSVGPHDLVRRIEAELGVEEVFWRVAVKPGKPVSFGVRGAHARLRASRAIRSRRSSASSSSCGPRVLALQGAADPVPRFEPGRLAAAVRRTPAATSSSARGRAGDDGARRARAARRAGVAHDRPGRRGRRARARCRAARASSPRARRPLPRLTSPLPVERERRCRERRCRRRERCAPRGSTRTSRA